MPKIASRLAVAAALASAATFGIAATASAATAGPGLTRVPSHGQLTTSAFAPKAVHPNLGSCGYDPNADVFTCQFLTTSTLYVLCGDLNEYAGSFPPGLYTIASPCDFDWGVYEWAVG